MKEKKLTLLMVAAVLVLSGCAGSASHKIVTAHELTDDSLNCEQIKIEIAKAQEVIDEVYKDKDDVSGKDVIDGILYFPFNLVAKSQNYNKALEAADRRIERLDDLKKEKKCSSSKKIAQIKSRSISEEIQQLSSLYKSGMLTEEEFIAGKQKLLGSN